MCIFVLTKRKLKMRDDQEFNIQFVSIVEEYPCLYDNTREDYHMTHVQERAWAKIAKSIQDGASIAECKKRWKNLRGSYSKHLKTYVPSGSATSSKRPYYLSEYISFVLPFTKSRQPKGNVDAPKNIEMSDTLDETFTEDLQTEEFENDQLSGSDDEKPITEYIHHDVAEVKLEQDQDSLKETMSFSIQSKENRKRVSSSSVLSGHKPKRNKIAQSPVTLEDVNKSALDYFEKKKQAQSRLEALTNDDADTLFLLSLLPDLKKMTDKQKRMYKVGVLNLAGEILDEP